MISLRDRTGKASAYVERLSLQRRLQQLALRLQDLDPRQDQLEIIEVKLALRAALDELQRCDQLLTPMATPFVPDVLPQIDTSNERQLRHHQMKTLLGLLDELPASCRETARALRRALRRELFGAPSKGR